MSRSTNWSSSTATASSDKVQMLKKYAKCPSHICHMCHTMCHMHVTCLSHVSHFHMRRMCVTCVTCVIFVTCVIYVCHSCNMCHICHICHMMCHICHMFAIFHTETIQPFFWNILDLFIGWFRGEHKLFLHVVTLDACQQAAGGHTSKEVCGRHTTCGPSIFWRLRASKSVSSSGPCLGHTDPETLAIQATNMSHLPYRPAT